MSKILVALALAPLLVFAQKEPNAVQSRPPGVITRMIRLQHADPCVLRNLLERTGAKASCDKVLDVLVVSGTPADVASIEQTAKELDAESAHFRSSDVQMTVYVVGASSSADGSGQIPPGLQPTVNQLKQLFPYAFYELLETSVTRSRVAGGQFTSVDGTLQPFHGQTETSVSNYSLRFEVAGITGSGPSAIVHIDNFYFQGGLSYAHGNSTQYVPIKISTYVDAPGGQKVVVGKAGTAGSNAIFLIVEAKVVD